MSSQMQGDRVFGFAIPTMSDEDAALVEAGQCPECLGELDASMRLLDVAKRARMSHCAECKNFYVTVSEETE